MVYNFLLETRSQKKKKKSQQHLSCVLFSLSIFRFFCLWYHEHSFRNFSCYLPAIKICDRLCKSCKCNLNNGKYDNNVNNVSVVNNVLCGNQVTGIFSLLYFL